MLYSFFTLKMWFCIYKNSGEPGEPGGPVEPGEPGEKFIFIYSK